MSWEPELEELRRREELARAMGGEERVTRQHASGRLAVRERVERLFDPGSFHETGALAGRGSYDDNGELAGLLPANTVVGQGARLDAVRSPFRTAERFSVEEIIDPRDTRPLLCDWAARAHELIRYELAAGPK